ncbi:hypothetical protein, partial [Rufibacter psychrotolerans]|uniref:hypothetical protein n=1 Tax=Rufibacter psychrotolerans TaxID=2812556 RepID=UPI00196888AD
MSAAETWSTNHRQFVTGETRDQRLHQASYKLALMAAASYRCAQTCGISGCTVHKSFPACFRENMPEMNPIQRNVETRQCL